MEILKKLKTELQYDTAIPLLDTYLGRKIKTNSKRYMHPHVHSSIIYNCQKWKKPKSLSIDEWTAQICVCVYIYIYIHTGASLVAQSVKKLPTIRETQVQSLGQEDTLEVETAAQFGILAWRISWTEEPGRLQSMGSQSRTLLK